MRYTVEVTKDSTSWYKEGTSILHRLDGPAIEWANGDKYWYKEGKCYTEKDFLKKMSPSPTCDGKVVEIDGKKYKLSLV